jgi:hypothetical protein
MKTAGLRGVSLCRNMPYNVMSTLALLKPSKTAVWKLLPELESGRTTSLPPCPMIWSHRCGCTCTHAHADMHVHLHARTGKEGKGRAKGKGRGVGWTGSDSQFVRDMVFASPQGSLVDHLQQLVKRRLIKRNDLKRHMRSAAARTMGIGRPHHVVAQQGLQHMHADQLEMEHNARRCVPGTDDTASCGTAPCGTASCETASCGTL